MKKDKYYLDYIDENGKIRSELVNAMFVENDSNFKLKDFYRLLNNIIMKSMDKDIYELLHLFSSKKPRYHFGLLYYIFDEFCDISDFKNEFTELKKYNEEYIELFMLVNSLRKM